MIAALIRKRLAHFALDLELEVPEGVTVLYGASGAGKTLTLDCLAGFVAPDSGRILLQNELLFDSQAGVNLAPRKRHCGYVFQDHALFPHMTIRRNLLFAAQRHPRLERHRRVDETLERFQIAEFAARYPAELSGGQKQRCSIARALVAEPRMLLLDEPSRGLDLPLRNELYGLLGQLRADLQIPTLLVTHSLEECFALGDGAVILHGGQVLQKGRPRDVYDHPASATIAQLLGILNIFDAEILALDPGRDVSVVRLFGQAFTAAYFPGLLLGSHVRICLSATQVRLAQGPGPNRIAVRLVRAMELADSVRLSFDPDVVVEVPRHTLDLREPSTGWFVEIPQDALRVIG